MKIRVLYFAWIRESVQNTQEVIEIPENSNLTDLLSRLQSKYPLIHSAIDDMIHSKSAMVMALNQNYILDYSIPLSNNDEIAFIPPISGG